MWTTRPSIAGVLKFTPSIEKEFRSRKRAVGQSWRMDETYVLVKGKWKYRYRAVDKEGLTIDFILTAKRDKKAALRFLNKAMKSHRKPSKINIDKSGANKAGIKSYNKENHKRIKIRECKYLNNMVEQDDASEKTEDYSIEVSSLISSPESLVDWIAQLNEMSWFNANKFVEFFTHLRTANNLYNSL